MRQRLRFRAMASACEAVVEHPDDATRALAAARAEVERIEAKYSRYRDDSTLSAINAAAGSEPMRVDEETAALLDFAAAAHAASGGRFDASAGVLRRAWDFRAGALPAPELLASLLSLVGWSRIAWQRPFVSLQAGMELDFGGFGKEYAADRACSVLEAHGVRHGYVNLGGDVRVVGPRRDGAPWRVGVQHPRDARAVLARVEIGDGALATSGDYERFFEWDGMRYCHVLDPRSGMPAQGVRSVSVVAPLCVVAGTHATVAMLHGARAKEYLDGCDCAYLLVDGDGAVHGSLA
jgi:FAD:protein FMN transferase